MPRQQQSSTQRHIQVRQVTQVQASWFQEEGAGPGAFTIQLILDHGAEEYMLVTTAEDTKVLLDLLGRGVGATFDLERKVLMFGNIVVL
jgi:hypothetical protein